LRIENRNPVIIGEKGDFEITVDIAAPPARVWAVMSDVERWHEWTTTVTSIERLDSGTLAVGARARIRQPKLPRADWTITALDEGRGFTWETRSPGVTVVANHFVEPGALGTHATLSLRFAGLLGPLVGWMTKGLNNRYLAIEAAGLKRRSENPAHPSICLAIVCSCRFDVPS
jgi:uncharacterized protein YndB with AHSA1/START domain